MATNLILFENESFGTIRVAGTSEEPLFCLADVAKALDIKNTSDLKTRLNQRGVGTTEVIDALGRTQTATFINEANLYRCIFQSRRPDAEKFQDWVCEEVLPSIRKTGSYSVPKPKKASVTPTRVRASIEWVKGVSDLLNLNDSSRLILLGKVAQPLELPLPDYIPSKGIIKSASELLHERKLQISVREFNLRAIECGLLKVLERNSSHGAKKKFKVITEKGTPYGENQVHPNCPTTTQPLWYADKFDELLNLIGVQFSGGIAV